MSDGERAGSPVLELHDVAVYFGGRKGLLDRERPVIRAVNGVSLTIGRAETVALVGESGCGKSTLSNAIVGLEPVQPGGSIRIGGDEVTGASRRALREIRRRVQMIFQDPALSLDPRATIGAAIAEPLLVRGVARGAALKARVARLLRQVGLRPEFASRYPHQFSGGQRQRVVIARALALEPDLVICDEPVSALDVSIQAQILNLLKDLQSELGLTYLFISHNLAVVDYIADRIAVMCAGRLVELAPSERLFKNPAHPYTRALLSAVPEPNIARKLDLTGLMEGRASDPAAWPAPFTLDGSSSPRLIELSDGHFVRADPDRGALPEVA